MITPIVFYDLVMDDLVNLDLTEVLMIGNTIIKEIKMQLFCQKICCLADHKAVTNSFNGDDLQRWIIFDIIAQPGNIHIQIAGVEE